MSTMIDSLERHLEQARSADVLERFDLAPEAYALVTLHRPSNVDEPSTLRGILGALRELTREVRVIFPAHSRTLKMILEHGLAPVETVEPVP